MRVRAITSIDTALKIFYEKIELNNHDMEELFGKMSTATRSRMKNEVLEKMTEEGVYQFCKNTINTEVAYRVWGIDVEDLEKRRSKLMKLGLAG